VNHKSAPQAQPFLKLSRPSSSGQELPFHTKHDRQLLTRDLHAATCPALPFAALGCCTAHQGSHTVAPWDRSVWRPVPHLEHILLMLAER
jgi:hypothetical protein